MTLDYIYCKEDPHSLTRQQHDDAARWFEDILFDEGIEIVSWWDRDFGAYRHSPNLGPLVCNEARIQVCDRFGWAWGRRGE